MKAKKLIAIGLVAVMTLGMSTSVFADVQENYDDYPQFNGWDGRYGPNDNVFHLGGTGWLESGVGINESVTNVIVPTMPNIEYNYGDPGLYDFGFDPQRLVKRTSAKKYARKMNFTKDAKENGVYFLNGPGLVEEAEDPDLNTFDNKSVKLEGTNIGTTPVAFTVTATMSGSKGFTYLEEEPKAEAVERAAGEWLEALYTGSIGTKWKDSLDQDANSNIVGFGDAIHGNTIWEVGLTEDEEQQLYTFLNCTFTKPQYTDETGASLISKGLADVDDWHYDHSSSDAVTTFKAKFDNRTGIDPSAPIEPSSDGPVGIYLGLDVAGGTEAYYPADYEAEATETVFKVVKPKDDDLDTDDDDDDDEEIIDAEATFTQVVAGTPENYKMKYDKGLKQYRLAIRELNPENPQDKLAPFQTVAFWFRGVATNNEEVPKELKVPALKFTWTFKNKKDDIPKAKLVEVNGSTENIPSVFTPNNIDEATGKIGLTFNYNVASIDYATTPEPERWTPLDSSCYTIGEENAKEVTIEPANVGSIEGEYKYLKVNFEGLGGTNCVLVFNLEAN